MKYIMFECDRVASAGVDITSVKTKQLDNELDNVWKFLCEHSNGPDNMINRVEALDMLEMFKHTSNPEKPCLFDKACDIVEAQLKASRTDFLVLYNEDDWKLEGDPP